MAKLTFQANTSITRNDFCIKSFRLREYDLLLDKRNYVEWEDLVAPGETGNEDAVSQQSDHVVRPLATYSHEDQFYMVLPWAHGDLFDFCRRYSGAASSRRDMSVANWIIEQSLGLARGLHTLHNPVARGKVHGRLAATTILYFAVNSGGTALGALPILKISDYCAVVDRRYQAGDATHRLSGVVDCEDRAISYGAPDKELTEAFDIWSFGCLLLDLIVWYIRGWEEIDEFSKRRCDESNEYIRCDNFFNYEKGQPKIKRSVTQAR
jgi:hypothetical protein